MKTKEEIEKHLSYYTSEKPSECAMRVAALLDEWIGLHHFDEPTLKKIEWRNDRFIVLKISKHSMAGQLATYDFDTLTTLVFLAHDHCIRVGIGPCNPQFMEIMFHPRGFRTGGMSVRHPTLESAVVRWRENHGVHRRCAQETSAEAEVR